MSVTSWQNAFFEAMQNPHDNDVPMQIYRTSIINGKIASLRITYRAIVRLIGKAAFDCISQTYLTWHPHSPIDIGLLGKHFSDYLKQHDISHTLPYIADLARLEWQRYTVFEAKEHSKSSVITETYHYPVDQVWICCQDNYTGDFDIDISSTTEIRIMIFRCGMQVRMRRI